MKPEARRRRQSGQAMIFFALLSPVLIGILALAVDLGNAFMQKRDLQNGSDFASVAASDYIGNNPATATDAQVKNIMNDLISANAPVGTTPTWSAYYVDSNGTNVGTVGSFGSGYVPASAHGVKTTAAVGARTYFARVLGASVINISAGSGSMVAVNPQEARGGSTGSTGGSSGGSSGGSTGGSSGGSTGGSSGGSTGGSTPGISGSAPNYGSAITALDVGNRNYSHSIISTASGTFTLNGNIIDQTCHNAISSNKCNDSGSGAADVLDVKQSSNVTINGKVQTVSQKPFDSIFYGSCNPGSTRANECGGSTYIAYNSIQYGVQYIGDPLKSIPEPTAQSTACPGQSANTYSGGTYTQLNPGVYTGRVTVNGSGSQSNPTLNDCGNGAPGIYIFQGGVVFNGNVWANNVTLFSQGQMTPGSVGCINPEYLDDYTDPHYAKTAIGYVSLVKTYGFIVHGGSFTVTAPTVGPYTGLALFQSREQSSLVGLNPCKGDAATINVNGAIYAHNIHDVPGDSAGKEQGDALVFGTDDLAYPGIASDLWVDQPPVYGGGNITITGCVVVDAFYTAGNANVTINFAANQIPVIGGTLVP